MSPMMTREKIAIEAAERPRAEAMDVRRAMEMLEMLKTEMPEVFAGLHHPEVIDK